MTEETRLVIIGNGFDLHHGMKSSYSHYKEWLKYAHPELLKRLERYMAVEGEWWNEFERNLAEFDIMKIIKECPRYYITHDSRFPPSSSNSSIRFFDEIRTEIIESFKEWVKTLTVNDTCKMISLPEASLYVSFNYTDTLEQVYGIPEKRILYIHGKVIRGDKLIFGHRKSNTQIEKKYMQKHGLREMTSFFESGSIITDEEKQLALNVSFFDKFPYNQIVKYCGVLSNAVNKSNEVVCYGHSFSDEDFQYLEWIAKQNHNLYWKVSWHSVDDRKRAESFFKQMEISNYSCFEF